VRLRLRASSAGANATVSEPESHEVGLQVPRCVYPEAAKEADLRGVEAATGGDFSGVGTAFSGVGTA